MKKCPFCAEEIQDEAIFCRFCKHDLTNVPKVKTKKCPYCAEEVPEDSTVCPICNYELQEVAASKKIETPADKILSADNNQSTAVEPIKAPVQINGAINGDTIEFDPPVVIKGFEYGSFQFDAKGAKIDKKDRAKAVRYAVEQLFRYHGFYRVRMDGKNAEIDDQLSSAFENMIYWKYALPQKNFYPTMDDIINNNIVEINDGGLIVQTRTLDVIEDNSSFDVHSLRNKVKEEKKRYNANNVKTRYNSSRTVDNTHVSDNKKTKNNSTEASVSVNSKKKLIITLGIVFASLLILAAIIIIPAVIGYNLSKYTTIPKGTYYDDNKFRTGIASYCYMSSDDYETMRDGSVMVVLYSDGTGTFALSKGFAYVEQGSFAMTSEGIECKYDSGKQIVFDSLKDNEDKTIIEFTVLDDNVRKTYICYLEFVSDPSGNIIDGFSYEALHGAGE